jgi:hypothetical protein
MSDNSQNKNGNKKINPEGTDISSGEWIAVPIGYFVHILVDSGLDPVIMFRVTEDGPRDSKGSFVRRMEILSVPNGFVLDTARKENVNYIHEGLEKQVDRGIIT